MKKTRISTAGFTIIELVIVIGIIILTALLGLTSLNRSRNTRNLVVSSQNALSVLHLAQSRTLAGENNSEWGVHLETGQIVLFEGTSYAGATSTAAYPNPSSIEIANISVAGSSSDIVFKKITGATNQPGTFDLRIASSPSDVVSITVDSSGKAYQTGTASSPAGTRLIDARHRLFNLGWSIKTALTLTLRASDPPNPDTVQNIAMAAYFDGGKTKFDWSGSMAVGGFTQKLRIHTTQLTDTLTLLSIDRDCRENNKKMNISIDAKDITTYEADCQTITVGPFGGTMSEL